MPWYITIFSCSRHPLSLWLTHICIDMHSKNNSFVHRQRHTNDAHTTYSFYLIVDDVMTWKGALYCAWWRMKIVFCCCCWKMMISIFIQIGWMAATMNFFLFFFSIFGIRKTKSLPNEHFGCIIIHAVYHGSLKDSIKIYHFFFFASWVWDFQMTQNDGTALTIAIEEKKQKEWAAVLIVY